MALVVGFSTEAHKLAAPLNLKLSNPITLKYGTNGIHLCLAMKLVAESATRPFQWQMFLQWYLHSDLIPFGKIAGGSWQ